MENMSLKDTELYQKIISEENIYSAIYSLDSYVFEKKLLSKEDADLLNDLEDKFNFVLIDQTIEKCRKLLEEVLCSGKLFDCQVYFKLKAYNEEEKKVEYRPIHTADLITQISIVCLLNQIMFDNSGSSRELSDIGKLLPSNFYGNLPCTDARSIFFPWQIKYKEYTENVIKAHKNYSENKKYKYEVALDIKKFFPSVRPEFLYSFLTDKLSIIYENEEMECLKSVILKLLHFKITNIRGWETIYYSGVISEEDLKKLQREEAYYTIGIPQGLPQAYFFGNLCMISIAKVIDENIEGDSYYYVDDSVIYTNLEHSNENCTEQLQRKIEIINEKLDQIFEDPGIKKDSYDGRDAAIKEWLNIAKKYQVEIHSANGETSKSTVGEISNDNLGELLVITKPASGLTSEIRQTIDDFEDSSLKKRVQILSEVIDKEIERINGIVNDQNEKLVVVKYKEYLKKLKQYKKFYGFRLKLLELRGPLPDSMNATAFIQKYNIEEDIDGELIEKVNSDIFLSEASLILSLLIEEEDKQNFIDKIKEWELKIARENNEKATDQTLYFIRYLKGEYKDSHISKKYNTLVAWMRKMYPYSERLHLSEKENNIKYFIDDLLEFNRLLLNQSKDIKKLSFVFRQLKTYSYTIFSISDEFKRIIINAVVSYLLDIEINESCDLLKKNNRPLEYFEVRLLMYIRNYNFKFDDAIHFIRGIIDEKKKQGEEKIDLALLSVLPQFKLYLDSSQYIDNLVFVHRFVAGIWKNGSKFLYFYTLHNQEHSVELINLSLKLLKGIEFIEIKENDRYILFLACYLHDISMVMYPVIEEFCADNTASNILYTEFKEKLEQISDLEKESKANIKALMIEYFEKIGNYFENKIRDQHPKDSALFIKQYKEINFIQESLRQLVADVSESHGFDAKDVYGLRSKAKSDCIGLKYIMILLRLADCLDMTKDRMSLNILKHNINNMPQVSKFHWISHMAIDRCNLRSSYSINSGEMSDGRKSLLHRKRIKETIIVDIDVNAKQNTRVKNDSPCIGWKRVLKKDIEEKKEKNSIILEIGPESGGCSEKEHKCHFLCKWMEVKNRYLFKELAELQKYLGRNDSIFDTKFEIHINYSQAKKIPQEYLDVVTNEIGG